MSKSLREQTIDFGNTAEWDQCLDTFCFSQSCENADHVNNCVWEMDFANSVPTSPGILLRWGVGCRSIVQLFSGQSSTSCQYLKACFSHSSWVCWESCCSNLSAYSTNLFFTSFDFPSTVWPRHFFLCLLCFLCLVPATYCASTSPHLTSVICPL